MMSHTSPNPNYFKIFKNGLMLPELNKSHWTLGLQKAVDNKHPKTCEHAVSGWWRDPLILVGVSFALAPHLVYHTTSTVFLRVRGSETHHSRCQGIRWWWQRCRGTTDWCDWSEWGWGTSCGCPAVSQIRLHRLWRCHVACWTHVLWSQNNTSDV